MWSSVGWVYTPRWVVLNVRQATRDGPRWHLLVLEMMVEWVVVETRAWGGVAIGGEA